MTIRPACYVFHIVNAYEAEGGAVVVDVVRHPRTHAHDRQGPNEGTPVLVRWTLDRARGRLTEHVLDDHGVEFPRFDDRLGGQNYRYAYTAHWWGDKVRSGPAYKHDIRSGRTEVHDSSAPVTRPWSQCSCPAVGQPTRTMVMSWPTSSMRSATPATW